MRAALLSAVGGSAYVDPRTFPSLDLWLDGPTLSLADGAAVSSWTDRSGRGNHAIQATVGKRPVYQNTPVAEPFSLDNINQRTTGFVAFDGNDDLLVAPLTDSSARTLVLVMRGKSTASGYPVAFSSTNGLTNTTQSWLYTQTSAGSSVPMQPVENRNWCIVEIVYTSRSACAITINGWPVAAFTPAGGANFTALGLGDHAPSGGVAGTVDIAEVVSYSRALSSVERFVMRQSLRAKYRINFKGRRAGTAQESLVLEPWNFDPRPAPMLMFHHGYTEGSGSILSGELEPYAAVTFAFLEAGWIVCASDQHGNNWGNQDAIDDAVALHAAVSARRPVSHVVHWGNSMGGLSSLNTIRSGGMPSHGWMGTCAASDLADMYGRAAYTASVKTAYGIAADGSDYSAKTSGHDPQLAAASAFPAIRYRHYYASADAAVPKAAHALALITKLTGRAVENEGFETNGGHGAPGCYPAADMLAFARRCIT